MVPTRRQRNVRLEGKGADGLGWLEEPVEVSANDACPALVARLVLGVVSYLVQSTHSWTLEHFGRCPSVRTSRDGMCRFHRRAVGPPPPAVFRRALFGRAFAIRYIPYRT